MANEEWEDQLQEIEEQEQIYSYRECKELGHFWGKPYSLLPWWYKPWKKRARFKKCQGCGIAQLVPRR